MKIFKTEYRQAFINEIASYEMQNSNFELQLPNLFSEILLLYRSAAMLRVGSGTISPQ